MFVTFVSKPCPEIFNLEDQLAEKYQWYMLASLPGHPVGRGEVSDMHCHFWGSIEQQCSAHGKASTAK